MLLSPLNGIYASTIMLLSKTERFLFVHIHKTAGTSLTQNLKTHLNSLETVLRPHDPMLVAQLDLGINLDNYFKVAFIRNPFDRLVSWYSMIMTHGVKLTKAERSAQPSYYKIWQHVLTNSQTFDEFITHSYDAEDRSGWKPFLHSQDDPSHEHYRHYYNSETRTIVEKRFAEDLVYFGYQF